MAISIHVNGKNLSSFGSGIQHHQERFDEKTGEQVAKNTNSTIKTHLTKFNRLLFKSEKVKDKSVRKYISDEFNQLNSNRVADNLRRKKKDTNVAIVGTLQISDDSLEKLGYNKKKNWNEQTDNVKKRVITTYSLMTKTLSENKKIYGELLTCTLHVDESTPHCDFICSGLDSKNYDFTVREVLNGGKGYKRGQKLSEMQDHLANDFLRQTNKKVVDRFDLVRGETEKAKKDRLLRLKEFEEELKEKEKQLKEQENKILKEKNTFENELKNKYEKKEKYAISKICNVFQLNTKVTENNDLISFIDNFENAFKTVKNDKILKANKNKQIRNLRLGKAKINISTLQRSKNNSLKSSEMQKNGSLRRSNRNLDDLSR